MKHIVSSMIIVFSVTVTADTLTMLIQRIPKISKLKNYQSIQQKQYCINKKSLLFKAIVREDKDLEYLLLQRGVSLSEEDINLIMQDKTPDDSLNSQTLHEIIQIGRKDLPMPVSNEVWQRYILGNAIRENDIEIAHLALQKGGNFTGALLNVRDLEMFQLLQKNGSDIHIESGWGFINPGGNLLHIIMQNSIKDDNLIEYILTQGLDIKALNGDGGNLFASLVHGYRKGMENDKLLKYATLLHMWGIDPYHKNYNGYDAFDIAKKHLSSERYTKLITIMKYRDFAQEKNGE